MKHKVMLSVASLAISVGVLLLLFRMTKRGASARLPQSIEDYRASLHQPDFGMFFADFSSALPRPVGIASFDDAKLHLREFLGQRSDTMGKSESIGNLVANYSAVTQKRVSFGRRWVDVTNAVSYDDSMPRTRRETLRIMEEILRTNGGFIFPLNATNVVLLTKKDLEDLGHQPE